MGYFNLVMQRTHVPNRFSDILPLEPRCEPAYDLQLLSSY